MEIYKKNPRARRAAVSTCLLNTALRYTAPELVAEHEQRNGTLAVSAGSVKKTGARS